MKVLLSVLSILLVILVYQPAQAQLRATGDEAELRALATNWERAWNQHDMKALAALFTEDADFVNVGARHWKGRKEIEAEHSARLSQFTESTWKTKVVTVQFLKPDVALIHIEWDLTGDKDPDGTPRKPRGGVFTWVAVKSGAGWLLRAAQNTNLGNLQAAISK